MLQNQSLNINVLDENGLNAFWYASFVCSPNCMKLLAEKGADVLNCDKNGNNAMHVASKNGKTEIVEYLLESKYPVDIRNNDGMTAFHLASFHDHLDIVKLQLKFRNSERKKKWLLNHLSDNHISALTYALLNSSNTCAAYFIYFGAYLYYDKTDQ